MTNISEYLRQTITTWIGTKGQASANIDFEKPKHKNHGDLTTNIAMKSAGLFKKAPRAIADELIAELHDRWRAERPE